LNDLKEIELTVQGKGYRLRTETRGTLGAVFSLRRRAAAAASAHVTDVPLTGVAPASAA
jgi:hypothetical protein